MRVVIQRVSSASVSINNEVRGNIGAGLLILVAAEESDTSDDITWLSGKIARLRIFEDNAGLMNRSVLEVDGEVLVVSQFTLFASTRKGNRPSFIRSAKPDTATPLYESFLSQLERDLGKPVARGEFGANMQVQLINDGPVTFWLQVPTR